MVQCIRGVWPDFRSAGTFRRPRNSTAVHRQGANTSHRQRESQDGREGRGHPPGRPKPVTLQMRMRRPQRERGMSKVKTATSTHLTPAPSFPTPPAPKLPSTPSNVSDRQGHSIPFREYSNLTSSRKPHCRWGEEDCTRKAGMSLGRSMTIGRQVSLPIKLINEARHLQQHGRQSHCEPVVFSASKQCILNAFLNRF